MEEMETFAWAEKPYVPKQPETKEIGQVEDKTNEESCSLDCESCSG